MGDWTDARGAVQGATPYASARIAAASAWHELDVTALIQRAVTNGNRGMMLRSARTDGPRLAGRLSVNRPQLIVETESGTITCPVLCTANFSSTSVSGMDSRLSFKVQGPTPAILQFDLAGVPQVKKATLRVYAEAIWGVPPTIDVYELDPPTVTLGGGSTAPRMGLAAEAGSETALKSHPAVLRAGDFSNLTRGAVFDSASLHQRTDHEQLPDPDAPGSTMYRGEFVAAAWNDGFARGSSTFATEHMPGSMADPLHPPLAVENEMFCRLYFFLEDDWNSTRDSNKMAIGWDLRMGWWNTASRPGYWQSTTGNGGARGTGLKLFAPKGRNGASQSYDCWEYQGHSIRMEAGRASSTGNPYGNLRPVQSYVYHLDQPTDYGDMLRLGSVCIGKGRWYCIEQQIRMNSIVGPFDALGNGQAVADGVLRTWIDGVMVDEHTALRWRRHPEMGIQGPLINWFYGGKQPSEVNMHYRMNHFAVARRYIGPRVAAS